MIKFTDLAGKASKAGPDRFKPVDGENRIRIVGSVIPSYKYWLKTRDNTNVPMECLSFDKENEKFDNTIKDVVRKYFPEKKCSWAYQSYVLDRATPGKLQLFDHKKKLFASIIDAAKTKMGDPTDPDTGWDIIFTRTKTGPKAFNVEYKLEHFKLENSALTAEEKQLIADTPPLEEVLITSTAEEQEEFIKNFILPEQSVPEEVVDNLTATDLSTEYSPSVDDLRG